MMISSLDERIDYLIDIANEDGIKINEKSLLDLRNHIKDRPFVVLNDDGNFRVIYKNESNQMGITFKGDSNITVVTNIADKWDSFYSTVDEIENLKAKCE